MRARDHVALVQALKNAGLDASEASDAISATASPEEVGLAAAAAGVPLLELREADGAGLEAMFLQLTADDQRDVIAPEGAQS